MIKRNIRIIKDYFSLVSIKNKYLILYVIFDILSTIVGLIIPLVTSLIIEQITIKDYNSSFITAGLLGGLYLINNLFLYIDYWCYANFFKNTYTNIHTRLINNIYNFNEEFTKEISSGKIINSSNMDIINVSEVPSYIFKVIIQIFNLIVILLVFAKQSILIGIYVLLINSIYIYFANYCNEKNAHYFKEQRKYADKLTGLLSQILNGLKDIKSFNLSSKLNNKFDDYRRKWQTNYNLKRKYFFIKETLIVFIVQFGKILLYIFLLLMIINDKISITIFILLISYYEKAKTSMVAIMNSNMVIIEQSVSLYRIKEIIDYKNYKLELNGTIINDDIIGKIEFKNVSFKYDKLLTINNISFKVSPNKITAIVGKTGAGKTTIFNLLLSIYKIQKGKILIDGVNIYNYNKEFYYKNITVVNQKTFLFNMSIRENLSLIDSNTEKQINVCKRVGIHEFIMSLPNGYDTILKENTINISGGQKQLLSLARALLTNSKIIMLDEITSSLDPETTNYIINLLTDLKTDHTILLITHNKELMISSDKLIVLNKGKITGIGTHKELIKNNKTYIELFDN